MNPEGAGLRKVDPEAREPEVQRISDASPAAGIKPSSSPGVSDNTKGTTPKTASPATRKRGPGDCGRVDAKKQKLDSKAGQLSPVPSGLNNNGNCCFMNAALQCLRAALGPHYGALTRQKLLGPKEIGVKANELSGAIGTRAMWNVIEKVDDAFQRMEEDDM